MSQSSQARSIAGGQEGKSRTGVPGAHRGTASERAECAGGGGPPKEQPAKTHGDREPRETQKAKRGGAAEAEKDTVEREGRGMLVVARRRQVGRVQAVSPAWVPRRLG